MSTGRKFAMISTTLMGSRRFRALPDDTHRLAYISIHLSPLCDFMGVFRYAPIFLCADLPGISPDQAEAILAELDRVGLIEFDAAETFLRIVGFHAAVPNIQNPDTVKKRLADLGNHIVKDPIRLGLACEVLLACSRAYPKWTPRTDNARQRFEEMEIAVNNAVRDECARYSADELSSKLVEVGAKPSDEIWPLLRQFLPEVAHPGTVSTGCEHGADTVRTHRKGKERETIGKGNHRETKPKHRELRADAHAAARDGANGTAVPRELLEGSSEPPPDNDLQWLQIANPLASWIRDDIEDGRKHVDPHPDWVASLIRKRMIDETEAEAHANLPAS